MSLLKNGSAATPIREYTESSGVSRVALSGCRPLDSDRRAAAAGSDSAYVD
jgi:hypothetical protein